MDGRVWWLPLMKFPWRAGLSGGGASAGSGVWLARPGDRSRAGGLHVWGPEALGTTGLCTVLTLREGWRGWTWDLPEP